MKDQRLEFVLLAEQGNVRELCRRFGIQPSTGYKWLGRYKAQGVEALGDRSRAPRSFRCPTPTSMVDRVIAIRQQHPAWGGRKIRRRLLDLWYQDVPASSTVTDILHRHGLISQQASQASRAFRRFERLEPNELWQMDFKGHFPLNCGRCHPLTILDDHSRFNLCLQACTDQQSQTVKSRLIQTFGRYGLPWQLLCDYGPPWAAAGGSFTGLTAWIIRLGITVLHGRPSHPQTQGKEERFHRTLQVEVLAGRHFTDTQQVQSCFDPWREVYNCQRPHQALNLATPASRYRPSTRCFPGQLPPVEYGPDDTVRKVQSNGRINFRSRSWFVSRAFISQPVALRPTPSDGILDVFYCHQPVAQINLRQDNPE